MDKNVVDNSNLCPFPLETMLVCLLISISTKNAPKLTLFMEKGDFTVCLQYFVHIVAIITLEGMRSQETDLFHKTKI